MRRDSMGLIAMAHDRREELEADFKAGRLEGQKRPPKFFWCKCTENGHGLFPGSRPANPKCESCKGAGIVERAGPHR